MCLVTDRAGASGGCSARGREVRASLFVEGAPIRVTRRLESSPAAASLSCRPAFAVAQSAVQ